jgi:anaerobic selenocysteine-containing dehydrogenase
VNDAVRTVYRACNLCEAICGLEIQVDGPRIVSIRGDEKDPLSRGHICPKGVALQDIHDDPNRLRHPLRRVNGEWRALSWEEAFDFAADKLADVVTRHGNDAAGMYAGNPTVHNSGTLFSLPSLSRVLKTRNIFSATSVDQLPQQLASLLMFGHQLLIPIPDIDRTHYFLMLGANPLASNGSMMTVPDVTKRLREVMKRGKVVVIDPRRTETAAMASEHHFIRPATDAALLMAMINVIVGEKRTRITHPDRLEGLDAALNAIAFMTPEAAAPITGIGAETIRRIAREFSAAPSAVCYGRIGTTLQRFGTLNQWLVQLVNILTGNLDREGGAIPTAPLVPVTGGNTRPGSHGRWTSRVRGLPETSGELPSAVMAEEILTPGDGQIRALITVCGNPVLSTPNGRQLADALDSLEFMLSIDIFLNETTRHADLILPPASSLNHDHYDLLFNALAVRNYARYNEAIWPRPEDERCDWEIVGELSARLAARLGRETKPVYSTRQVVQARAGEKFDALMNAEHGLDLGPLTPSLYERVQTADGKIQCAPPQLLADVERFQSEQRETAFALIGRRHLRSNNSWMHNSHRLTKGPRRDQLLMHPDDLASLGLVDGQPVQVTSAAGSVRIPVLATDSVMPGVVSLPHGYGASSYNDLADDRAVDAVSGNAALNGIAVQVRGVD